MNAEEKRPRGRPRKNPIEPEAPKRPRGRPRNTTTEPDVVYRHYLSILKASRSYYERNRVEIAKRRKEQREAEKLSGEVAVAENE
jgi:hypothetical protein